MLNMLRTTGMSRSAMVVPAAAAGYHATSIDQPKVATKSAIQLREKYNINQTKLKSDIQALSHLFDTSAPDNLSIQLHYAQFNLKFMDGDIGNARVVKPEKPRGAALDPSHIEGTHLLKAAKAAATELFKYHQDKSDSDDMPEEIAIRLRIYEGEHCTITEHKDDYPAMLFTIVGLENMTGTLTTIENNQPQRHTATDVVMFDNMVLHRAEMCRLPGTNGLARRYLMSALIPTL